MRSRPDRCAADSPESGPPDSAGTDYSKYTQEQKKLVAACLATAGALKAVLDTPILTEEGNLTKESEKISDSVQQVLDSNPIGE